MRLLLGFLYLGLSALPLYAGIPARLLLNSGTVLEGEMVRPSGQSIIRVSSKSGGGWVEYSPKDIKMISFAIGGLEEKARPLLEKGAYTSALKKLEPMKDVSRYMDIRHNAVGFVELLAQTYYCQVKFVMMG